MKSLRHVIMTAMMSLTMIKGIIVIMTSQMSYGVTENIVYQKTRPADKSKETSQDRNEVYFFVLDPMIPDAKNAAKSDL